MSNHPFDLAVDGQGLYDITPQVAAAVAQSGVSDGLVTVFIQHTSASLLIQENADPAVQVDLQNWLSRLVPELDSLYTHTCLLYTSPSPRDATLSRMPSSA